MDLQPGQTVGHYEVRNRLGQGGMSNVYLATDKENDREVVLKFPHESIMGDIATHERFNREVKIGQLLHHPNIQLLYALETEGSSPYLVLEYVPGSSMRGYLRDRKHPPRTPEELQTSVNLGIQIGKALAYAHEHHVAHRDLKPENVIVTPDHVAKVMDFGIALLKGARRVTWGPLSNQVGTPDYMSPEQIEGQRGDARTDIYALGTMLYELITGKLPYEGDNPLAIMNQHVNVKPSPMHSIKHDVPPALDEIVMKAIRLQPQHRWTTMTEFVAALEDWSIVNVAALAAEREAEPAPNQARKALSKLPIPISTSNFYVLVAVIVLMVVVVSVFELFAHHPHVH